MSNIRRRNTLSDGTARNVVRVIDRVLGKPPTTPGRSGQTHTPQPRFIEGFLDTALSAPSDGMTAPTTATLKVWIPDPENAGELIESDEEREITNRNPEFSKSAGDYLLAVGIKGEWRPVEGMRVGDDPDCPDTFPYFIAGESQWMRANPPHVGDDEQEPVSEGWQVDDLLAADGAQVSIKQDACGASTIVSRTAPPETECVGGPFNGVVRVIKNIVSASVDNECNVVLEVEEIDLCIANGIIRSVDDVEPE